MKTHIIIHFLVILSALEIITGKFNEMNITLNIKYEIEFDKLLSLIKHVLYGID